MTRNKLKVILVASIFSFICLIAFQLNWLDQSMQTLENNKRQVILRVLQTSSSFLDPGDDLTEKVLKLVDGEIVSAIEINQLKTELRVKIDQAFSYVNEHYSYQPVIISEKRILLNDANPDDIISVPLQFSVTKGRSIKIGLVLEKKSLFQLLDSPLILYLPMTFIAILIVLFIYLLKYSFNQERYQQMQTDFTNSMLHELKTPVFSISLALKSLKQRFSDSFTEKQNDYLNIIESENNSLKANLETVLQHALLESKTINMDKESIDLVELLNELIVHFETLFHIQIKNDMPKSVVLNTNRLHLKNVLVNLIDNAIKYSNPPVQLTIRVSQEMNTVTVEISDQGIGISEADLNHIFDKFYRVKNGDIHHSNGFGLGLSYVKLVADSFDWKISVKSQPRLGTTVRLSIS